MVIPKRPCPTKRIYNDARGNDGGGDDGGVSGGVGDDEEGVDLREVDCCAVRIKYEENRHRLHPVSPLNSTRYSHTIIRDVTGTIVMKRNYQNYFRCWLLRLAVNR